MLGAASPFVHSVTEDDFARALNRYHEEDLPVTAQRVKTKCERETDWKAEWHMA